MKKSPHRVLPGQNFRADSSDCHTDYFSSPLKGEMHEAEERLHLAAPLTLADSRMYQSTFILSCDLFRCSDVWQYLWSCSAEWCKDWRTMNWVRSGRSDRDWSRYCPSFGRKGLEKQVHSVTLVRERTIPTEWQPHVGEVGSTWSARRIPTAVFSDF
jgi:hypothetical protein